MLRVGWDSSTNTRGQVLMDNMNANNYQLINGYCGKSMYTRKGYGS